MQSNVIQEVSLDDVTPSQNVKTNDYGDVIFEIPNLPKEKNRWRKPLLAGLLAVILIGVVVILVLSLTNADNPSVAMNKNEALFVLQDLSNTTIDDDAYQLFEEAFDVFDEDGDGLLTEEEFAAYLELEVEYFSMFQKIDADDDDILSYREVVCYMNEMWQIQPVRDNMVRDLSPLISSVYNFSFVGNETNIDHHSMFIEYVSMFLYFVPFDLNSNGYIHHNEYLSVIAQTEFAQMDTDDNGRLEKDEFFNMLYGVDGRSWRGQMSQSYGDNYEQIMQSVNAINITSDMVQDIELHLCSSVFESVSSDMVRLETRRRMVYCYGPFYGIQCTHLGCVWVFHYLCI